LCFFFLVFVLMLCPPARRGVGGGGGPKKGKYREIEYIMLGEEGKIMEVQGETTENIRTTC
jgi:hypothetical protein